MNYRLSRALMWVFFCLGLLVVLTATTVQQSWPVFVGAGIIVIGVAQALYFYRCPHCGRALSGIRGSIPIYCPYCREKLK